LRVTVVATGLNNSQKKRQPVQQPVETTIHVVRNGTTGLPENGYSNDVEQAQSNAGSAHFAESPETTDMFAPDENIDYLDIPSFLRNQAD